MTTVIDERVVEMRFNNEDFEKNVAQSMNTLDNLKKSLNFDSANSLKDLGSAAKGFSLSGITETITEATSKFSVFEVAGITAIANITNKAVDFGLSFAKSLSLDQLSTGMDKYAEKTTAIQTIISATGASIEEVTEQIDKLNWFTDETSYNLTDMISNIAKFTNSGIGLSDAVTQMMGIATAAGDAGKGVQGATHAMEGFSKAMSKQYMDQSSWMWIRTSGIDTIRFKDAMLEAAVAAGTLKKVGDGLYETLKGNAVTAEDFATNLKDKWMNAEVMQKGLAVYGEFSNRLQAVMEDLEFEGTTSDFMDVLDRYKTGAIDASEAAKELDVSSQGLKEILDELSSSEFEIGEHAFKMSQEAKTFQEAIDSVKDAVSTGWMTTFETIFGNYEEAKKLWTGLANDLWEAFASGGAERNEVLAVWKQLGGRDSLIKAAVNFINLFVKPLSTVKSAFKSMFPDVEGMGQILFNLTEKFREFTESIQPSEETLKDIYFIFKGLFTVGKLLGQVIFGVIKAIIPAARPFGSILEMIIHFLGYIGRVIVALEQFIGSTNIVQIVLTALGTLFANLGNILKTIGTVLGGAIIGGITLFVNLISKAVTAISNFVSKSGFLSRIFTTIGNGINRVKGFFNGFNKSVETTTTVVKKMQENFSGANDVVVKSGTLTRDAAEDFEQAATPLEKLIKVLQQIGNTLKNVVAIVIGAFTAIGSGIATFFTNFIARFKAADITSKNFFDHIKALFTAFLGALGDAGEKIKVLFEALIGSEKFKGIADVIHKVTEKIKELTSSLDVGKIAAVAFAGTMIMLVASLAKIVQTVTETIGSVKGVFDTINSVIKGKFDKKKNTILELAEAFAIIAGSLVLLAAANENGEIKEVADAMMALTIAFTICAAALKGLDFLFAKFSNGVKAPLISTSVLALAGSMAILAGAMYILNEIDIKDGWRKKLAIIGAMLLELVTAAALISRAAPKLAKGSILLLALAGAMYIMIRAFKEITSEDLANVEENMVGFGLFFGAMSMMIAAAGRIKITSALSLLLVAKAIQIIMPEIKAAIKTMDDNGTFTRIIDGANKFVDKFKAWLNNLIETIGIVPVVLGALGAIGTIVGGLTLLIPLFRAIGSIGNIFKGIGAAAAGIGIGIVFIVKAMQMLGELRKSMSPGQFQEISRTIMLIMAVMGGVLALIQLMGVVSNIVGKRLLKWTDNIAVNFAGAAAAFVGIGASMVLIAVAMRIIAKINQDDIVKTGLVLGSLMAVLALVVFAAGTVQKGIPALMAMMGAVAALAVLMAEMAIAMIIIKNSDPNLLWGAIGLVSGFMLLLAVVLGAASSIKSAMPVFATLALIIGSLAAIGAALYFLKGTKWEDLVGPVKAIGILLGLLTITVMILSHISSSISGTMGTIRTLIAIIGAIAVIGAVLYNLREVQWDSMIAVVKAIGLIMLEIAGLTAVFGILSRVFKNDLSNMFKFLALTLGSVVVIGVALAALSQYTWEQFVPTIKAIAILMGVMAGFMLAVGLVARFLVKDNMGEAIALMAGTLLSFIAVGTALYLLSNIEWDSLKGPLASITGVMGTMIGLIAVVGLITKLLGDWKKIGGALALMAGAIVTLAAVGYALATLSQIPVEDLMGAVGVMSLMMLALTGLTAMMALITVVVGAVAGIFGGGAAGFFAVPALLISLGLAVLALGYALQLAAGSVSIFAEGLGLLYDPLSQLSTLDLPTIAGGLALLGASCLVLGVGLGIFGVGGLIGATAFFLLSGALWAFNAVAEQATEVLKELAQLDLGSIAKGFAEMGFSGLVLGIGAVGVMVFALAINMLAKALEGLESTKDMFSNFFGDMQTSLTEGASKVAPVALVAATAIGKAFEKGWRTVLQWFSPPGIVVDFFADMGYALSDNWELTRIADGSAATIADVFKGSFQGGMDGLAEWFQSYLGGMFGMASNFIYKIRGLVNSTGQEISQFGANGMPTDVINKMYGGTATASTFTDILKEQLNIGDDFFSMVDSGNYILEDFVEGLGGGTDAAEGFGDAMEGAGEKTGKAGKALKEFRDSLADTISGQLDMFSKFEMKTGMTADTILENMRSNIDGFASWSHRMTVLSERFVEHGISDTLYKKLAEMGPKGYETMNAIYQMTDDQLDELRDLWATGLTLPEGQADIVGAGYQYMGEMAVQGFSDALNDHKAAHEAAHGLGKAALDGLSEVLKVHSPSKATEEIGYNLIEGLRNGIDSVYGQGILYFAVKHVSDYILTLFNENFSEEIMSEVGSSLLTNMFTDFLETMAGEETNPVIQAFVTSLSMFEAVDEALTLFAEHVKEMIYELWEISGDEEPSAWVSRLIQYSFIQAIVTALDDYFVLFIAPAILNFCHEIIDKILFTWQMGARDEMQRSEVFYHIGLMAMQGLYDGILEKGQECIALAGEIAEECVNIMNSAFENGSPSKLTRQMGIFVMEGLSIGFNDGAENVYKAAQSVADGSIEVLGSGMGRLQDVINEGIDFNPVITPMLDLSYIRSQMDELNAMMNNPYYGYGQNGGNFSSNPESAQQINFTQNNYSPKALSRYEIYRQTKNQLSTIRKVVSG